MPKPNRRARYAAAAAVAGGQIEPDWKYFLDNVREKRGSYGIHCPAPADGANPSTYLQYEKPRAWGRPTAAGASTSSRGRGAGHKRRHRRMMEDEDEDEDDDDEEDEEEESSSGEPAMYGRDPNIEKDYRVFFRHLRPLANGGFVLEYKGKVIAYDAARAMFSSDESEIGVPEPNPPDRRARRQKAKNVVEDQDQEEEEDVKNVVAVLTREEDGSTVKEDQKKNKKGKNVFAVPSLGKDGAMAAEQDHKKKKLKKEVALPSKGKDGTMAVKNLKDKKAGKKEVVVRAKGKDSPIEEVMVIKVEEEDEQLQIVPAVDELGTTTRLRNSIDGHETKARIASGSHGVIWPIHINDRNESNFKQRLIDVLDKPFSQGEYDKLFGMATVRKQLTKERRTRLGVKYYYSNHEKGKSYLDSYPDLAKQVEEANYPNRLALLRGLFFWLENIGQEDQFRPWRDDHRHYKIMSL